MTIKRKGTTVAITPINSTKQGINPELLAKITELANSKEWKEFIKKHEDVSRETK